MKTRYYQPVLTDKEWEEGSLASFEVYHYLDNAKKDWPGKPIAVYEGDDIEEPTFVDVRRTKIRLVHDSSPMNPFEYDEGQYPIMSENTDFSKGDIDTYLLDQVKEQDLSIEAMLSLTEIDPDDFDLDFLGEDFTEEERWDEAFMELEDWLTDSIRNRAELAEALGIKHYYAINRGYSQGDAMHVFVCWTPQFERITGVTYEDATVEGMESTFDLYGLWAWGDVYGFIVEDEETGEFIDSCYGFYGTDWKNNGIMDNIMAYIEDKTEEQVLEILEDLEVEYSY